MTDDDEQEISRLEAMLAGRLQPDLRLEAAAGKLAELYLNAGNRPERFPAACNLAQTALGMLSPGDPLRPKLMHVLARTLRAGGPTATDVTQAWQRADALDRDAWLLSLDPAPQEALLYAAEWADLAWSQERWGEAADAYQGAEIALARIIRREKAGLPDRLELLAAHGSQAARGAYACARAERPRDAMVVLERAAALVSSYGEQTRAIRDLAAAGHSDLRDRLMQSIEDLLAESPAADSLGRRSAAWLAAQAANDAAVMAIRALPGWERFAAPANWHDIELAAQRTAIAYLAHTDKGTVILIMQAGATSITYCCVDATTDDLVTATRPFTGTEFDDEPGDPKEALAAALRWLGGQLMYPVHQALGGDHRVTLIPFGLLALFPLHAGLIVLPATSELPERPHVLFHPANVSYAYSARTLNDAARRRAPDGRPATSALVINNPVPLSPDFSPLLLADFERDAVAAHFRVHELAGRAADTAAVLDALPGADVVHFSCHGSVDRTRRYAGVLLLASRQILTAEHFTQNADLTARLVVLSACRSGAAALGHGTVTSLPAMLIAAGVGAVLSTFWHTDEMATLLLISRFYALWQGGAGEPARVALGQAQVWLAFSPASELRAACPEAALATPAGQQLADAAADFRLYNDAWYWAAFFLVGDG